MPLLTALDVGNHDVGNRDAIHPRMGDAGATELAAALHLVPLLATLGLAHCGVGEPGARALAQSLPATSGLTSLLIAGNPLGAGLGALLAATPQLRRADLGAAALASLCDGLRRTPALTRLDLRGALLECGGALVVAQGLEHVPLLADLRLADGGIGPSGVFHLASALQRAEHLALLDLGGNTLGSEGARRLAAGLCCATALTALLVPHNALGGDGALALVAALVPLPSLVRLDLSCNGISECGWPRRSATLTRSSGWTCATTTWMRRAAGT
jgi:Ran GTPase-activating protein (RanGAP) involved in mRNA processing and transport